MPFTQYMKSFKFWSILIIVVIIICYWYGQNDNYDKYPPAEGPTATIFLIDGLDNEIFKEELEANKLPVIKGLIGKGMYVENGISSFPTMTGYGFYPFITGYDATKSGILGLRWFDRSRLEGNLRNYVGRTHIHMNDDLTDSIHNYFELSGKYYTASVNTYMNKGVKHNEKTGWAHTTAKYEGKSFFRYLRAIPWLGKHVAKDHFEQESLSMEIALQQLQRNPKVHWVTFPSPDAYNHVFGTDDGYRKIVRHIDSLIGVYLKAAEQYGQTEKRLIAVVSDHGISDVSRNIDFCGWAEKTLNLKIERGKSVNVISSSLDEKLSDLKDKDGYFVINGNLTAYLYLKDPTRPVNEQWSHPLPPEMIQLYPVGDSLISIADKISRLAGIELVAYKSAMLEITLLQEGKKAVISARDSTLIYMPIDGNPLNYGSDLQNRALSRRDWLEHTAELEFPYAVPRLWDLLQSKGIGDIVMTSQKGYDLANDYEIFVGNYKGGHGGLRREIMTVPFIMFHPDIKAEKLCAMTNEDLGLRIGQYLGYR